MRFILPILMGRGTARRVVEGASRRRTWMQTPGRTYGRARRLRRQMTPPEVALWAVLRREALDGFKFRRQHPFGPYILDFYCAKTRIAIEVDGWGHAMGDPERDYRRDRWLAEEGVLTLRFPADLVMRELNAVAEAILAECRRR